jgi:hypothetical protein
MPEARPRSANVVGQPKTEHVEVRSNRSVVLDLSLLKKRRGFVHGSKLAEGMSSVRLKDLTIGIGG